MLRTGQKYYDGSLVKVVCVPKGAENYQKIQYRITQVSHIMLLKCIYTGFAVFFQFLEKLSREVGNLYVPFDSQGWDMEYHSLIYLSTDNQFHHHYILCRVCSLPIIHYI